MKRTTGECQLKIWGCISEDKPKTVQEISKESVTCWETTNATLFLLWMMGIVTAGWKKGKLTFKRIPGTLKPHSVERIR